MKHLFTIFILILTLHVTTLKAADALPEYTLKAAYLYNFALLTDWPPNQQEAEEFNLCIYKSDSLGKAFDVLSQKQISQKPIKVSYSTSLEELKGCHLIFVPNGNTKSQNKQLIKTVKQLPILLVSDDDKLDEVHIQILQSNDRLIFTINTKLLAQIGLNLSSRLLNLAKEVK